MVRLFTPWLQVRVSLTVPLKAVVRYLPAHHCATWWENPAIPSRVPEESHRALRIGSSISSEGSISAESSVLLCNLIVCLWSVSPSTSWLQIYKQTCICTLPFPITVKSVSLFWSLIFSTWASSASLGISPIVCILYFSLCVASAPSSMWTCTVLSRLSGQAFSISCPPAAPALSLLSPSQLELKTSAQTPLVYFLFSFSVFNLVANWFPTQFHWNVVAKATNVPSY